MVRFSTIYAIDCPMRNVLLVSPIAMTIKNTLN